MPGSENSTGSSRQGGTNQKEFHDLALCINQDFKSNFTKLKFKVEFLLTWYEQ